MQHALHYRTAMVFRLLLTYLLAAACFSQPAVLQQDTQGVHAFLPSGAVVKQELRVDFENTGTADTVLLYNAPDKSDDAYYASGMQIVKYSPGSGWTVAYQETGRLMKGADDIRIEKLKSARGTEGVLVINYHSGAGTVTVWHVLAYVRNKIAMLDPAIIRSKLLNARGYADNGYNSVKSNGDLVSEDLAGYSRHAARCCPNRPSLEMNFKFTGNSVVMDSVKELPYGVPKSGWHGPLLHLNANGFWAYGYQIANGFLVLGGSESPKDNAPSTPRAIVALRKNLVDQGVLGDAGDYFTLMADHKFTSPSVAAGVMLARPVVRVEWKDENGRTAHLLADIKGAH